MMSFSLPIILTSKAMSEQTNSIIRCVCTFSFLLQKAQIESDQATQHYNKMEADSLVLKRIDLMTDKITKPNIMFERIIYFLGG